MTEPVTSKLSIYYPVKIVIVLAFVGFIAYIMANQLMISPPVDYPINRNIAYPGLIIAVVFLIGFIGMIRLESVTVSADNISIRNFLTGKNTVINYADIDEVETIHVSGMLRSGYDLGYQKLKLKITSGKVVILDQVKYENYDSLKAAIYDHKYRGI